MNVGDLVFLLCVINVLVLATLVARCARRIPAPPSPGPQCPPSVPRPELPKTKRGEG